MTANNQTHWTTEDARRAFCQLEDVGEVRPPTPDPTVWNYADVVAGKCTAADVSKPKAAYQLTFEACGVHSPVGCRPMMVIYRGPNPAKSAYYVKLACVATDGSWKTINIPMSECNDSGAKLRARLLKEGVNVPVETHLRKFLLHFVLNSPVINAGEVAE